MKFGQGASEVSKGLESIYVLHWDECVINVLIIGGGTLIVENHGLDATQEEDETQYTKQACRGYAVHLAGEGCCFHAYLKLSVLVLLWCARGGGEGLPLHICRHSVG